MFNKLLFLLSFATIFANSLVSFSICFQFYAENFTTSLRAHTHLHTSAVSLLRKNKYFCSIHTTHTQQECIFLSFSVSVSFTGESVWRRWVVGGGEVVVVQPSAWVLNLALATSAGPSFSHLTHTHVHILPQSPLVENLLDSLALSRVSPSPSIDVGFPFVWSQNCVFY